MDYDVIIIGGSYAGLSAALALGRARKRTLIIDAGQRRNRFAHEAHGLLGQDGRAPWAIVADARAEVATYPTVAFLDGTAVVATPRVGGFAVTLEDGAVQTASRLILATGVVDELPDLPGLRERWGAGVYHCPYCHGFEVVGQRLGVLAFGPLATHQANLIPEWGPTTFFTNGVATLSAVERDALGSRCAAIEETPVAAVLDRGDGIAGVRLSDGRTVALDALFIGVPFRLASPLAEQLGCALDDTIAGPFVRVDPLGETTVPGVFAAGDLTSRMGHSIAAAVGNGYQIGAMVHRSLIPALPH
jgi:thioredoxin reductase